MKKTAFDVYKSIKHKLPSNFKGYPLNKLFAARLLNYLQTERIKKHSLRVAFEKSKRIPVFHVDSSEMDGKIVILREQHRQDYDLLIGHVSNYFKSDFYILDIDISNQSFIKLKTSLYHCIIFVQSLVKFLFHFWNLKQALFFSIEYVICKQAIKLIERENEIRPNAVIAFNSSVFADAMIVSFFKKRNVATFSLQHGSYLDFGYKVMREVVNYENITAEYFLAWNHHSCELIDKYDGFNKVKKLIVGHPKPIKRVVNIKKTFNNCLVLLPRDTYDFQSLELLEKLSGNFNDNRNVFVKPHPNSDLKKIDAICAKLGFILLNKNDFVETSIVDYNIDFSICFNSTAYYQSLLLGVISLVYDAPQNEQIISAFESFKTKKELMILIDQIKELKTKDVLFKINESIEFGYSVFEKNVYADFIYERVTPVI